MLKTIPNLSLSGRSTSSGAKLVLVGGLFLAISLTPLQAKEKQLLRKNTAQNSLTFKSNLMQPLTSLPSPNKPALSATQATSSQVKYSARQFSEALHLKKQHNKVQPASMYVAILPEGPQRSEKSILPINQAGITEPTPLTPIQVGLTLESALETGLSNHPAIQAATANIRSLRGKLCQAGLAPNPTLSYISEDIGEEGGAGQHGIGISQRFVRGNKLQLSQQIVRKEIVREEQRLARIQQKVQTDIRLTFYQALIQQERIAMLARMIQLAEEGVEKSRKLIKAGESLKLDLLQAQVEHSRAKLQQRKAFTKQTGMLRSLATLLSITEIQPDSLVGSVNHNIPDLQWQSTLAELLHTSPEIAEAMAEVQRARSVVQRACKETVPDLNIGVNVVNDTLTGDTLTGINLGITVPLWNRNQGAIAQARAQVTVAQKKVDLVQRRLENRLAEEFARYESAKLRVTEYRDHILPPAKESITLASKAQVGYLSLLTTQRTYSLANLQYLTAISDLWRSVHRIDGYLLDNSLESE